MTLLSAWVYVLKQVMAWFDMTAQLRAREEEESGLQLVLCVKIGSNNLDDRKRAYPEQKGEKSVANDEKLSQMCRKPNQFVRNSCWR